MDQIHRPRNTWPVLRMVATMSLIGLLVQYFCIYRFGAEGLPERMVNDTILRQCVYTLAGLGFMIFLYCCDYSLFCKYEKVMGTLFLGSIMNPDRLCPDRSSDSVLMSACSLCSECVYLPVHNNLFLTSRIQNCIVM